MLLVTSSQAPAGSLNALSVALTSTIHAVSTYLELFSMLLVTNLIHACKMLENDLCPALLCPALPLCLHSESCELSHMLVMPYNLAFKTCNGFLLTASAYEIVLFQYGLFQCEAIVCNSPLVNFL